MIDFFKALFKKSEAPASLAMGEVFTFFSESAALAVFDPVVLQDRLDENLDWFIESHAMELIEVQRGDCALIGLKSQGNYKVCLRDTALTEEEKAFAKYSAYMGVKILSGKCYIGDENPCKQLALAKGDYDLLIYGLDYDFLDDFDEVYSALKERLADIVILIQPRQSPFITPLEENMFADIGKHYLFVSPLRNEAFASLKKGS